MEKSTEILQGLYDYVLSGIPKLLTGIGFLIGAFIVYKLVLWIIKRLLKVSKIEKLNSKINEIEFIAGSNFKIDLGKILLGFVKFILILIMVIVGSELMNLQIVSEQIGKLLSYLPQFLSGILIFAVGAYLANLAKKTVYNLMKSIDSGGSKALSSIVFYLIFIFVSITAINQIGIDTQIISNNLSYIIGACLIAVTIAVGLGSREIVYRLILGFYTKKNLEIGMKIQVGDITGKIEAIDNISLVVRTEKEKIIFPIDQINNTTVRIIEE